MSTPIGDGPGDVSAPSTPSPRFRPQSPRVLRGLATVFTLTLVVVLLAAVLVNAAGNRGGTNEVASQPTGAAKPTQPITNWPPQKPTFSPTLPWGTPTPTLPPVSSALTPEQAWGPSAAMMTLNTQLDATHVFHVTAISPEGRYLLGYEFTVSDGGSSTPAYPGYYDITTKRFTSFNLAQSSNYPPGCCQTDGRYLLDVYDSAPGTTGASGHTFSYIYDRVTAQLWELTRRAGGVELDHGLALFSSGQGISEANLATRIITQLQLPAPSGDQVGLDAYTWPYVVYTVYPPDGNEDVHATRAHNLQTGQDVALPQVDPIGATFSEGCTISGDALFIARVVVDDPQQNVWETTLYEDDAFLTSNAAPVPVATLAGELGVAANGRLVDMLGSDGAAVWDRAEHRLVQVAPAFAPAYSSLSTAALAGHYLVVSQEAATEGGFQAETVTIYDTDTLPTTPSA